MPVASQAARVTSRREFLRGAGLLSLGAGLLSACGAPAPAAPTAAPAAPAPTVAASAAKPAPAATAEAKPAFLAKAQDLGYPAKDCTYCHVNAGGGAPWNDRGNQSAPS